MSKSSSFMNLSNTNIFNSATKKKSIVSSKDIEDSNSMSLNNRFEGQNDLKNEADLADIWWEKLNRVVSGGEEASGPDELQEMMRTVVEKAEMQINARKNKNNVNIKNLSNPSDMKEVNEISNNKKKVTFDLTGQSHLNSNSKLHSSNNNTDQKIGGYISLQQKSASYSSLKSSLKQNRENGTSTTTTTTTTNTFTKSKMDEVSAQQLHSGKQKLSIFNSAREETNNSKPNVPSTTLSKSSNSTNIGFEEEAKALQLELAEMQKNLKDRMQRYNKLIV